MSEEKIHLQDFPKNKSGSYFSKFPSERKLPIVYIMTTLFIVLFIYLFINNGKTFLSSKKDPFFVS